MASSAVSGGSEAPRTGRDGGGRVVPDGHLPITELLSDRAGAPSPFGDDQTFPLPVSAIVYQHPTATH
jgi:succinate dehydrogenase / fumarate reductase iron-sulfur subunit